MPFRVTKEQLARRDVLAANLRVRATALNATIAAFNREVAPLARAVVEAQFDYNETMEQARTLANQISEAAQEAVRCEIRAVAGQRQRHSGSNLD